MAGQKPTCEFNRAALSSQLSAVSSQLSAVSSQPQISDVKGFAFSKDQGSERVKVWNEKEENPKNFFAISAFHPASLCVEVLDFLGGEKVYATAAAAEYFGAWHTIFPSPCVVACSNA